MKSHTAVLIGTAALAGEHLAARVRGPEGREALPGPVDEVVPAGRRRRGDAGRRPNP